MKIDARDWIFQVEDTSDVTPVWTDIAGINTFGLKPSENSETADTTDFQSGGEYEGQIMQRGGAIELEGFRIVDDETPEDIDPGQVLVDELGTQVSEASLGRFRFRHITQTTTWVVWRAYVELADQGGGNNDKDAWGATITRSGAATTAAVA